MKSFLLLVALLGIAVQKPKLSQEAAQEIAVSKVPGTVECETTEGINYSFDIRTTKDIRDVIVNGDSGKIISKTIETEEALMKKKKSKPSATLSNGGTLSGGAEIK